MTIEKLKDFHRGRLLVLANAGADLLALETIPCKLETQVSFQLSCPRGGHVLRVWEKTSLDHDFDCFLSQFKTALADSLTNSRIWCIMCRPLLSC
jgi:S-methylmethionine-dependent homocysteine/selenocysteine methylase